MSIYLRSLASRIALATSALTLLIILVGGGLSYVVMTQLIEGNISRTLKGEATLEAQRVANKLETIIEQTTALARNTLLSNALADSAGREANLTPFLRGVQRIGDVPVFIYFTDYRGMTIASNQGQAANVKWEMAAKAIDKSAFHAEVLIDYEANPWLILIEPIIYPNTGTAEGELVVKINMADFLPSGRTAIGEDRHLHLIYRPQGSSSREVYNHIADYKNSHIERAHVNTEKYLHELDLAIEIMANRESLLLPLHRLSYWFVALGVFFVAIAGRAIGKMLTGDIRKLEAAASNFMAEDKEASRFEPSGSAETIKLGQAFNTMLDRLNAAHEKLARHARREIDRSETQSRTLLEAAGEGIYGVDLAGHCTFVNQAALLMLGFAHEEFVGANHHALIHHTKTDGTPYLSDDCPVQDAVRNGVARRVAGEIFWRKDGSCFPVEYVVNPTIEYGEVTGAVVVFHDVSAILAAEDEIRRSNAELEQFSYAISHDLQEPLRMVSSYMTLIERRYVGKLDADADDYIHFAVDGAKRMSRMISDLLEYSRVQRKGMSMEDVGLEDIFADAVLNLQVAIEDSCAVIRHDKLPTVRGDHAQLLRLFQNMLGNALKYRKPEIPPQISVSATQNGEFWIISVSDNGIGIAPSDFGRLFKVFQRLHTREQYEGNGIGLALCKRIVERHGGRIWLESEPDIGSTFFFTLPAAPEP
jgi:PAS domain S-box-containing protein